MSTPNTSVEPPDEVVTLDDFTALHREHAPGLLKFLRLRVPPGFDAEDVHQEVWLKVSRHLSQKGQVNGRFRPWLFTVARNTLADLKDQRRRPGVLPDGIDLPGPEEAPIEQLLATERFQKLEDCLGKLTPEIRELIRQKALGKKSPELAAQRNVKPEMIYRWVSKALADLRACMNEGEEL